MQNFIFIVDKNRKLTAFVQSSFYRDWKSHDHHEWNLQNIFSFSSFLNFKNLFYMKMFVVTIYPFPIEESFLLLSFILAILYILQYGCNFANLLKFFYQGIIFSSCMHIVFHLQF
jgi:hypothetical protein